MKNQNSMVFIVFKVLSIILAIVGLSFLLPAAVALYCREYSVLPSFLIPTGISIAVAAAFMIAGRNRKNSLSIRASFVIVATAWIGTCIFGAIPFYASGAIPSLVDAVFESVSGFTTTGATILSEIETLPRSINMWRCLSHWLGGMGIVVLTVALLPLLGIGGFQLVKAETTGPEKGKFTQKITTTAKILWFIYMGLTAIETVLLKIAGMDFIDALSHSFSTLGTGGFSTRNASIAAYDSAAIDTIVFTFMFLAGINFTLYYYAIIRNFTGIKNSTEFKVYLGLNFFAIAAITILELPQYGSLLQSLRYSSFQVSAILTTTGYATWDYTTWNSASQVIILMLFFIGGCSGSTSGGVKVIRWVVLYKQLKSEMMKTIHPHGIFSVRLNKEVIRPEIIYTVSAFFFLYFLLVILTSFIGALFGMDILTAFSGAVTMVGNVGPGFNMLGPSCNCGWLAAPVKYWYCLVMIAGRLELFTIAIFTTIAFWKK